jgi:WD40 repeat protein
MWLAYIETEVIYEENQVIVIVNSASGIETRIDINTLLSINDEMVELLDWLDNEHLVLNWLGYDSFGTVSPDGGTTVILNPFTEEFETYPSDYENIYTLYPQFIYKWDMYNITLSVYSPGLDRVLYLSYEGVVIWDLIQQQKIKVISDNPTNNENRPVWAPDGERFIMDHDTPTGRNLFLITKNGDEQQVTFLEDRKAGNFINFAWSPDGQEIAFWLFTGRSNSYTYYNLVVLDLDTGELRNFCVPAYNWHSLYPAWYPIWTIDGQGIIAASIDVNKIEESSVIFLDLINQQGYKIAKGVFPLGWVANDQE